jgi:hypothetical protein
VHRPLDLALRCLAVLGHASPFVDVTTFHPRFVRRSCLSVAFRNGSRSADLPPRTAPDAAGAPFAREHRTRGRVDRGARSCGPTCKSAFGLHPVHGGTRTLHAKLRRLNLEAIPSVLKFRMAARKSRGQSPAPRFANAGATQAAFPASALPGAGTRIEARPATALRSEGLSARTEARGQERADHRRRPGHRARRGAAVHCSGASY